MDGLLGAETKRIIKIIERNKEGRRGRAENKFTTNDLRLYT